MVGLGEGRGSRVGFARPAYLAGGQQRCGDARGRDTQMEILQGTLVRAGFIGHRLSAATWALYNHVMGSASTETALHISDEERRVGQEQLRAQSDRYPTLSAHGYLYDDDWDGSFTTGLDYLLDGLEAQLDERKR
jgi:hypothetical protein